MNGQVYQYENAITFANEEEDNIQKFCPKYPEEAGRFKIRKCVFIRTYILTQI